MNIVCTGPECAGKTTLSNFIHHQYHFGLVREVARDYLLKSGINYTYASLNEIAHLQLQEQIKLGAQYPNLVCDTDLLTIIIWGVEKYQRFEPNMISNWLSNLPDMYLLCSPDIPWEYDVQRENPNDRDRLFNIYQTFLEISGVKYHIISGNMENRISQVAEILAHSS